MVGTVFAVFFALLFLGAPVVLVVYGAAAVGVWLTGTNPSILVQQVFAGTNSFIMLAVPFFIISGDLAAKGRTSDDIVKMFNAFLGHLPGGLGMATIIACAFFGAITGSSIATVVAIGSLMLPKLLNNGYPKSLSLGIITAGGTLGVMIPPSIPMLTVSVVLGTSVGRCFTAGFAPGILLTALFCIYVYFMAKKSNVRCEAKIPIKERLKILRRGIPAIMFPVIVLGSIYSGIATPTEASIISLIYVMIVELFHYKTFTIKSMLKTIEKSIISAATLTFTISTAQVFAWFMTKNQLPQALYSFVTNITSSQFAVYAAICVLFLIAGCFTNVTTVVLILGPIMLSTLNAFGIDLVPFIIVTILLAQVGFLTPPFGLCLFVTMKVGKAGMPEIAKACLPYILLMLVTVALIIAFPQIANFLPDLVYGK